MFTTTGSRGLYKAPLSKALLLVLGSLSALLTLLPRHHGLFSYNLQAVKQEHQVWRLVCGRLICLDLKDTFCSSLLIYNFRIFERRFGSRKFASFLFGTWVLSALTDFLLAESVHFLLGHQVEELPSGLLSPVFALFVPFYRSIPRVPVTRLLGHISITNKTLVYIVGLQLLTSSSSMWLVALSGLISGALYHSDVLALQRVLGVPAWLSRGAGRLLEPLFRDAPPGQETPLGMGATLELQRQQRMDQLDQQLLLNQYHQNQNHNQNRAGRNQAPPQAGLLNWDGFFPSLRHRGQNRPPVERPRPPVQPRPSPEPSAPPLEDTPTAAEQVARLMEMGFSRIDAQEALRASNNDINLATNFLLQH